MAMALYVGISTFLQPQLTLKYLLLFPALLPLRSIQCPLRSASLPMCTARDQGKLIVAIAGAGGSIFDF
jgi:hypothetical protein